MVGLENLVVLLESLMVGLESPMGGLEDLMVGLEDLMVLLELIVVGKALFESAAVIVVGSGKLDGLGFCVKFALMLTLLAAFYCSISSSSP